MDILNALKDVDVKSLNRGKLKTCKNKKYVDPVKTEILQNNPCYIIKEITKNEPPTIRKSGDINENVCIIYRKLPVQRGQRESRVIGPCIPTHLQNVHGDYSENVLFDVKSAVKHCAGKYRVQNMI